MSTLTKPYAFTGGQFAVASQVNADFDTVYSWINGGGAMWNDGSVAFTNLVTGPSADPTIGNHLTRKSYVDAAQTAAQTYATTNCMQGWTGSGFGKLKLQGGSSVVSFNGAGNATITYPSAFASVLSVVVSAGDYTSNPLFVLSQVGGPGPTTGINLKGVFTNGTLLVGTVRVNWIAVGT